MTIPADTMLSYFAGQVFAIAGADAIEAGGEAEKACLNRGRIFTMAVTVPIGTYFVLRWPEWSWMYFAGERSHSKAMAAAGLTAYPAAHELGFRRASLNLRKGKLWRAIAGLAIEAVAAGMLSLAMLPRLRWLGDEREYRLGLARDVLFYPDFIISIAASGALAAPGALFVIWKNYKEGASTDNS